MGSGTGRSEVPSADDCGRSSALAIAGVEASAAPEAAGAVGRVAPVFDGFLVCWGVVGGAFDFLRSALRAYEMPVNLPASSSSLLASNFFTPLRLISRSVSYSLMYRTHFLDSPVCPSSPQLGHRPLNAVFPLSGQLSMSCS